jgi:hypothetical protein
MDGGVPSDALKDLFVGEALKKDVLGVLYTCKIF